jgi:hypothetical protein
VPLDLAEGQRLSNEELARILFQNAELNIGLLCHLPVYPFEAPSLRLARATQAGYGALPNFMTGSNPDPTNEGVAVPDATLQGPFSLASPTQDVVYNSFSLINQSMFIDDLGQLSAAVVRMGYVLEDMAINGDSLANPAQADGLAVQIPSSQQIMPNDTINNFLDILDLVRLIALLKYCKGEHIILVSRRGFKEVVQACLVAGVALEKVREVTSALEGKEKCGAPCGDGPELAFHGFRVVISDKVRDDQVIGSFSDGTAAYAVCLGEGGFCGLSPKNPESLGMGIRTVLVSGTNQEKFRLYCSLSVVLKRQDAAACLLFRPRAATQ